MIEYLFWSYEAFLHRIRLTGDEIATMPLCNPTISNKIDCSLAKLIATSQRMQQWLQSTSLFKESWLYVVGEKYNWWWSVEVCIFTVGVWTCYLCVQSKRKQISYVWVYMILGQICAISVAQNLFSLAIAMQSIPGSKKDTNLPLDANLTFSNSTRANVKIRSNQIIITLIRLFMVIVTCSGLLIVYFIPSDLPSILAMHGLPFILLLPFFRSDRLNEIDRYFRLSTIYAILAFFSACIRINTHLLIFGQNFTNNFQTLLQIALSHPAQSSISADAICIAITTFLDIQNQRSTGLLSNMQAWTLSLMIPFIGSSSVFATSLAIREAKEEDKQHFLRQNVSASKSKKSSMTPSRKDKIEIDQKSPSKVVRKKSSSKSIKTTPSETSSIKKKLSSQQVPIGLQSSEDDEQIQDSPAARAKSTRARPRRKDMMDGERFTAEEVLVTPRPKRTIKRASSSRSKSVK